MDLTKLPVRGTLEWSENVLHRMSERVDPSLSAGAGLSGGPCNPPVTALGDYKGELLQHVRVVLIFWGSEWAQTQTPSPTSDEIAAAVYRILSGFYMMKLAQYRQISQGTLVAVDVNSSDPPSRFTDKNVTDMIQARVGVGTVPSPPNGVDVLYSVILPQRVGGAFPTSSDHANTVGFHSFFTVSGSKAYWLWANNLGKLSGFPSTTSIFSHELIEACSDAEFLGIRVQNDLGTGPEIGDPCLGCGQATGAFTVQAYWSAADQGCVAPSGSEIGACVRFSASATKAGDLHVCAINGADGLYHTLGTADDTWPYPFGDVQRETRKIGPNPGIGPTPFVACAAAPNVDLHLCALDAGNGLWHTVRKADGSWPYPFGDVQRETRKIGPNPGIGRMRHVACSVDSTGILHVCVTDVENVLWRTTRMPNGAWPAAFAVIPA